MINRKALIKTNMTPQLAPVVRRATSQRSANNAAAVIQALTQEALVCGLDNIAASSIAKRAGLTTGAIYSRYENSDEMLIALWQQVVASELRALIIETVEAVTTHLATETPTALVARLEKPSGILGLGAEFMVMAQRNDVVGEVVITEVSKWLHEAGLQTGATAIERAGVVLGASIAIGSTLRSFITSSNPKMGLVLNGIHNAYLLANAKQSRAKVQAPVPIRSNTGSALRDALIDATAEVMSKTGFTGATISRIARKSGVTSGSIYNFYPDKEALMNDAVNVLMRTTQTQTLDAKRAASSKQLPNFGLTDSFHFGLSADRQTWLRFRQECIIATRHHKTTFRQLKKVVGELDQAMIDSFPKIDKRIIGLVSMGEQAIGYGFSSLFGYTNLLDKCDFDAIMVQVAKQNSL